MHFNKRLCNFMDFYTQLSLTLQLNKQARQIIQSMSKLLLSMHNLQNAESIGQNVQASIYSNVYGQINGKILKISSAFLIGSRKLWEKLKQYKENNMEQNSSADIVVLNLNDLSISVPVFARLARLFQKQNMQCCRNQSILKVMETCQALQLNELNECIVQDIFENFDEYDFFLLYSIAQRFQLKLLHQKLLKSLKQFRFEQLNFNRFGLVHCQQKIFINVLKLYLQFKNKSPKKGPLRSDILQIIKQFNQINSTSINIEQLEGRNLDEICQQAEADESDELIKQNYDENSTAQDQVPEYREGKSSIEAQTGIKIHLFQSQQMGKSQGRNASINDKASGQLEKLQQGKKRKSSFVLKANVKPDFVRLKKYTTNGQTGIDDNQQQCKLVTSYIIL